MTALLAWLRSQLAALWLGERWFNARRRWQRWRRRLSEQPASLQLFYRVDDPQAHLLLLLSEDLAAGYAIEINLLVLGVETTTPDAAQRRYLAWRHEDARRMASAMSLPRIEAPPQRLAGGVEVAMQRALRLNNDVSACRALSSAYWQGNEQALIEAAVGMRAQEQAHAAIRRREAEAALEHSGHYDSAALVFDGEVYRGAERLRHLTRRLRGDGFAVRGDAAARQRLAERLDAIDASRPRLANAGAGSPVELFFSFRSPYSWLAFDRVAAMADAAGRPLRLRPVRPMVTRGVPLPAAKRRYLVTDAAREARVYGVPFGRIVDPLGDGVAHCLAGFYAAAKIGREREFTRQALAAIWSRGIDMSSVNAFSAFLRELGLSWKGVRPLLADAALEAALSDNAGALEALDLWGVPTIVVDGLAVWGQDRLWQFTDHGDARDD